MHMVIQKDHLYKIRRYLGRKDVDLWIRKKF